jgi:hypothetical protein
MTIVGFAYHSGVSMVSRDVLEAALLIDSVRIPIEIIDLVKRGSTIREAAIEVGVHENTALKYCKVAGIKSSSRRGRPRTK